MPTKRRLPPPWSIEDTGAAFVVKDGGWQKLAGLFVRLARGSVTWKHGGTIKSRNISSADLA